MKKKTDDEKMILLGRWLGGEEVSMDEDRWLCGNGFTWVFKYAKKLKKELNNGQRTNPPNAKNN